MRSRKTTAPGTPAPRPIKAPAPVSAAQEAMRPHMALLAQTARRGTDAQAVGMGLLLLWLADDVEQSANTALAEFGLTESKLDVLMIFGLAERGLVDGEAVTPSYIATYIGVTRSTVTGLLDWLEKRALLTRALSQEDRRSFRLTLTDEGRAVLARALPAFWQMCASLVDYLDDQERAALQTILAKVWDRLKARQR